MKKLWIAWLTMAVMLFSDTQLSNPKPNIDNPRQFIFPITSDDEYEISHVLSSASNVMKFYGPQMCEVAIVCYGKGIKAVLKESHFFDTTIQPRLKSLMTYDVEFIACGNTMRTYNIDKKALLENVEVVTAGIVELIERQVGGWIYIRP